MAALLRIISEDALDEEIERLSGGRILQTIAVCQEQYEEMVDDRMSRELGVAEDFRGLRRRLRWLLSRYKGAVETLHNEDDPETEAIVSNALRPLVVVNALISRGDSVSSTELDAELVQTPEFDILDAAEQPESSDSPTAAAAGESAPDDDDTV
jgi:hypothetical protein